MACTERIIYDLEATLDENVICKWRNAVRDFSEYKSALDKEHYAKAVEKMNEWNSRCEPNRNDGSLNLKDDPSGFTRACATKAQIEELDRKFELVIKTDAVVCDAAAEIIKGRGISLTEREGMTLLFDAKSGLFRKGMENAPVPGPRL
ncbi:MAG: hypothetical protein PHE27_01245 [Alphaproteobacteria bacterium]|nr:hypothetical protein [Alphaproteobacteria bacterium]